jgi:hypothetical protein
MAVEVALPTESNSKLYSDFDYIRVCNLILTGAPLDISIIDTTAAFGFG